MEGLKTLLVHEWVLKVYAKTVHQSFSATDIYDLKTVPLQRLRILRLAKPATLSSWIP